MRAGLANVNALGKFVADAGLERFSSSSRQKKIEAARLDSSLSFGAQRAVALARDAILALAED
jgi:hypothetical protein